MSADVQPIKDEFINDDVERYLLGAKGFKISSFEFAYLTDEKETHYMSSYA